MSEQTPATNDVAAAAFMQWFLENYPSNCVLSNPSWHAPKIFRAARYALEEAAKEVQSETTPSDDLPLRCKAEAGVLDMRIGEKVLAFATEKCPALWDADKGRGRFTVYDPTAFAKEVERVLNHEFEDGSTRLTRMLDAAVLEAIEQGAAGVEGE